MNEQQFSDMALTFAGGLYDADTELIRFGARDYDSRIGRWTTRDPIGLAGGMNQYAYVEGNPMTLIDPSGLFGTFGGFNFQGATTGGAGSVTPFVVYLGEDRKGAGLGVAAGTAVTMRSIGLSFGRGVFGGFYANTYEEFSSANSYDFNSIFGGFSLYLNDKDEFEGLSLSGPSAGLSFSYTPGSNSVSINTSLPFISYDPKCVKGQLCPK